MHQLSAIAPRGQYNQTADETALIVAARTEPAAFGSVYEHFCHRVYAYMRARTANDEDAADLTQQVFLQALRNFPRFQGGGGEFAAWLFRIARNAAVDYHRAKRETVPWDLLPEALHPEADADTEAAVLQREALERLRVLLLDLDLETRELLALRFGAGLTSSEIAQTVGRSRAAVRKRLSRTFQTLKEGYREPF